MDKILHDNVGRRSGRDRRQFSYDQHIPERRSGKDRENGKQKTKIKHIRIIK